MAAKRSAVLTPGRARSSSIVTATLVQFDGDSALVRLDDGSARQLTCEILADVDPVLLRATEGDVRVLVALPEGDALPVLVGVVGRRRRGVRVDGQTHLRGAKRHIFVDGETLVFDAQREIVLRCGKSEILLTRDGKVVIKGKDVVTRAAQSNRIRGANVKIN